MTSSPPPPPAACRPAHVTIASAGRRSQVTSGHIAAVGPALPGAAGLGRTLSLHALPQQQTCAFLNLGPLTGPLLATF